MIRLTNGLAREDLDLLMQIADRAADKGYTTRKFRPRKGDKAARARRELEALQCAIALMKDHLRRRDTYDERAA